MATKQITEQGESLIEEKNAIAADLANFAHLLSDHTTGELNARLEQIESMLQYEYYYA